MTLGLVTLLRGHGQALGVLMLYEYHYYYYYYVLKGCSSGGGMVSFGITIMTLTGDWS
jgi:hypothetical protein